MVSSFKIPTLGKLQAKLCKLGILESKQTRKVLVAS